ncbi:MAG: alcohol dehydrogenase catalytic domain-containing protein, partial [Synechococcales cyanobacterium T60_A2020_003]|nr:alcohol dehydrogenase catalytic domain-containing protein [Synechococcales cyanobacterium T60_A2020_003]
MRAMILEAPHQPLRMGDRPIPTPQPDQVLIRVHACGICRTDLHILDGELPHPKLPLVMGHQIVGTISALGEQVTDLAVGQRIGVPWLGQTCQHCRYCLRGQENLCDRAQFTGYSVDGGYAEYAVADAQFCFPLPDSY